MGDPTQKLIDELRSLLDETTILSITSDYDLNNPAEFAAAREVLLAISKDVEAEEATGFNPSGFCGDDLAGISPSNEDADSEAIRAIEGDLKSNDGLTTTTESSRSRSVFSGSSSKTSIQENPGILHVSALDDLTDEQKVCELASMFVSLNPIDVKLALQKVKGDADLAMDELLNLQWLEQMGQRPKGVDAFYVSDDDVQKGKGRGKGKRKGRKKTRGVLRVAASKSSDTTTASEESSHHEVVDNGNIGFISERFALPVSEIELQYQRNNFSLGDTILEILDNYLALDLGSYSHPDNLRQAGEQEKRVPWIPHKYFGPIFDRAVTSQAAIEVVDALANHFEKPAYMKYDVSYSVVASDLELASELPLPASPIAKSPRKDVSQFTTSQTIQQLRAMPTTLQEASAAKAAIAASTKHSFASASSAYKKGRSNPWMRQAAAFYADRARSEAASHRKAISTEARLLVDQQSTKSTVDLHGASVQDGIVIALEYVWEWWNGLGEDKARKGSRDGFKVITGLGRHSADGKSPMRTNVFKALLEDGWKFEVLTGAYLVTGRR